MLYSFIFSLVTAWDFTTDDAYISWFYARQLVNGNGLNWHHLLPRVEGYSNFLWVLLASLFIKLQLPLAQTMKWFSVISLGAGFIFLYRLGRLFFSPLLAILPIFIFSHYIGVVWWTISGLESAFFCSLSILLIWQSALAFGYSPVPNHDKKPSYSTPSWVITNCTLLLLVLTRFEGLIWIIPLIFFFCCQIKKNGFPMSEKGYSFFYLWILISIFCFLIPYALYFLWRIYYFGHLIPNSFSCKAITFGKIGALDFDYFHLILPLIIASIPYFLESKDCRHLLLWLPSVLYGLMLWSANSVVAYFLRLFLGPFALFSLLPVLGVYQFLGYFRVQEVPRKFITTVLIICLTLIFISSNNSSTLGFLVAHYKEKNDNRIFIANLLNSKAKYGAKVLLGDCGIIPFNARPDLRFIDRLCLNNVALTQAPFYNNLELYADYLKNKVKPDWMIFEKFLFDQQDDPLTELLRKKHIFQDYKLIGSFSSGEKLLNKLEDKSNNFYLIYQRIN